MRRGSQPADMIMITATEKKSFTRSFNNPLWMKMANILIGVLLLMMIVMLMRDVYIASARAHMDGLTLAELSRLLADGFRPDTEYMGTYVEAVISIKSAVYSIVIAISWATITMLVISFRNRQKRMSGTSRSGEQPKQNES
jgi:hypothetical protein